MNVPIRITSKVDGFRRLGIGHPSAPVEYPDDHFTPEDLAILKADPVLTVEEVLAEAPAADAGVAVESTAESNAEPAAAPKSRRSGKKGS